jgi:DNA repair protein RadA/Sms
MQAFSEEISSADPARLTATNQRKASPPEDARRTTSTRNEMAKAHSVFVCRKCGRKESKWTGRCTGCNQWDTFEEAAPELQPKRAIPPGPEATARAITEISGDSLVRLPSEVSEFDRVLGGGIVPGGLVLLGGDPGVGKSTLLLWAAELIARRGLEVLYVSGEESAEQIALRGQRLGAKSKNLRILAEVVIERIVEQIAQRKPALVIIDSVQTVYLAEMDAAAGSLAQIRESALRVAQLAKTSQIPVILIGHVTKEGSLAGPKALEHMVDVVLQMEGERGQSYRILRAQKNRFGSTDEVGVFEMGTSGLIEVPDPSAHFLAERPQLAPGSVVVASQSASRPMLIEVQALVAPAGFSSPRRTADGFDQARVALLLAVLERRAGLILHDRDVFVNVVGGLTLDEPGADLGVALAVASSYTDRPAQARVAVFGEVGLTGEIRAAGRPGARLKELLRHGFNRAVMPEGNAQRLSADERPEGVEIVPVKTLEEAIEASLI